MALFLKSFELKQKYRDIKPFSVKFRDGLNIIVGENGSGKSTLLHLLTDCQDKNLAAIKADHVDTKFLDTEKMNPRIKGIDYATNGTLGFVLGSRFVSHGQSMLPLVLASKDFKDLVLFVDEPEAGISLKNQQKIVESFHKTVNNNCQIVATTHSYVIIKSVPEVFDLDTRKWISSQSYLSRVI
ncbi:MAG: AAA family ATPase [Nitrosarchaeum sp.]|nr:AAA family ATPase [Nitrosarchaeum sp.]